MIMAGVIIANSISIGIEMQLELEGRDSSAIGMIEHVFLTIFVLELALRAVARGAGALRSSWFRFDALLVFVGIVSSWVVEPIVKLRLKSDPDSTAALDAVSEVLVLRILRLLRLARALRMFEQFQEMWKLAKGLLHSIRTVLSACTLLLGTIYVFACISVEVITKNELLQGDPETHDLIQEHLSSLHVTMLTLFRWTHTDATESVYVPIVKKSWLFAVFFGALWLIVTVCLMNLVTAVIVDTAIAQGGVDREMQKASLRKKMSRYEPYLHSIFHDMDKSKDGELQFREIQDGLSQVDPRQLSDLPDELMRILASEQLIDLFEFLDTNDSGTVDEQEFLHGISHLLSTEYLHSVSMETTQALHILRSQSKGLDLIRDLCIQGDRLRMASDHESGALRISVYARPRLQVGNGTRTERASAKRNYFDIHLDKPLAQAHPMHSHVSVEGNGRLPERSLSDATLRMTPMMSDATLRMTPMTSTMTTFSRQVPPEV
jgi:voltage-gated sodium channel